MEDQTGKRGLDDTGPGGDERPTKAARRKKACEVCRLRKIKCDATRPVCDLCKSTGAQCRYTDKEDQHMTVQSATSKLSDKLEAIEKKLDRLVDGGHSDANNDRETVDSPKVEAAKDFLQIPAQKTSADAVLTWPVFEGQFPPNALIEALFKPEEDVTTSSGGLGLHSGGRIMSLVERFLQCVHTKNPILSIELLLAHSRRVTSEGFGDDAHSCLVLLACALGSIASPFEPTPMSGFDPLSPSTGSRLPQDAEQAQSYFNLAQRRLGLLRPTLTGIQCYFYAGVYLMYSLRPLLAWQQFNTASTLYRLYEQLNYGASGRNDSSHGLLGSSNLWSSTQQARFEQCLYWSCFKSESEFRVELPLPLTEVANDYHSEMFPVPPTPEELVSRTSDASIDPRFNLSMVNDTATDTSESQQAVLHSQSKRLYNEEESWYYYLTEIAVRRIGNRIVNTFYTRDVETWLNVKPLLRMALEFDNQISSWSSNLPPAMQHWKTAYTIRDPTSSTTGNGPSAHVSQELSWALENRLLEARSWLYQPFLYNLIHHRHISSVCEICQEPRHGQTGQSSSRPWEFEELYSPTTNSSDVASLKQLISSGISCNLAILQNRMSRHRHHGTWFDLRSLVCASLILLMVVKSGHETWIPGGAGALWGPQSTNYHREDAIAGRLGQVLQHLTFWSMHSPDMTRHREVLEVVARDVRDSWHHRSAAAPRST